MKSVALKGRDKNREKDEDEAGQDPNYCATNVVGK